MISSIIQGYKFSRWVWLWSAYWRLFGVHIRIKLRQGGWLKSKITVTHKEYVSESTEQALFLQMYESVRLAARLHLWQAACLPRSIVLADMLMKRGIDAKVMLGVNKGEGALASHAWVEVDGAMIGEPESVSGDFTKIGRSSRGC